MRVKVSGGNGVEDGIVAVGAARFSFGVFSEIHPIRVNSINNTNGRDFSFFIYISNSGFQGSA